jgi:copper(I)-binding protein
MLRYILMVVVLVTLVACGNQNGTMNQEMHAEGEMGHGDMGNMPMTMPTTNTMAIPVASKDGIALSDPWARMGMSGDNSAAYMYITNTSGEDTLVSAQSSVAKTIELHTVIKGDDGMMQMRPVEGGITVPAQGNQTLKPGSYHIMLIGLNSDLKKGDTFEVELTFANAGSVPVTVEVR